MNYKDESAEKIAEFLLQIKAIKLNVTTPFVWASGIKSPIYCDNRITLSFPQIRTYIRQQFVEKIHEHFGIPDAIAGVATGGIAHGVLVAQDLGLPFVYVRSEEKKHGLENKIEGFIESGKSVIVIEDLVSTGGSSLKVVDTLRSHGILVKGMISIFQYQLKQAEENFNRAKCKLISLCNYDVLLQQALNQEYITENDLEKLTAWKNNPENWA